MIILTNDKSFNSFCNFLLGERSHLLLNQPTENSLTDRELVHSVLRGNNEAFSAIVRNTQALVGQIVSRMVSNSEDRKDIVQDIYMKVFRNLGGFGFRAKLSTWIAQIAYNSCLNWLEKKKLVMLDDLGYADSGIGREEGGIEGEISFMPIVAGGTEGRMRQRELAKILAGELKQLSPLFRTLIGLFHEDELSYEEISGITGVPVGTVKSYLFRARKQLKDQLLKKYQKQEL